MSLLKSFCVIALLALQACSSLYRPTLPSLPNNSDINTTQVVYPILLLHGLGQKSHVWDDKAVTFYTSEMGLHFGGELSFSNGRAVLSRASSDAADFFTVSFTNPTDSISGWANELDYYIRFVLEKTKARNVILIGYSMGGLASRRYLTTHPGTHHVKRLITIGTPHLGSPFARVYKLKTALTTRLNSNPNFISAAALKTALAAVTSCESDVAFDSPAMRDLMRPEDGGQFLDALGKAEHPSDVDYVSVVGDLDVLAEAQHFNSSAVQEVMRRTMELFDSGLGALFSPGDGVVSHQSQTLNNVPWFRNSAQHQRLTRTVSLTSVHTEHLKNSNEIQRVTLEDRPEFKSAEFYTIDGKPSLVVDFSDYLPASKSEIVIQYPSLSGLKRVQCSSLKLVRSAGGEPVCRGVIAMDDADYSQAFSVSISISNYFSNKAVAEKQWMGPPL